MESKLISLINLCLERSIPFAAYRLPGEAGPGILRIQKEGRMLFLEDLGDIRARRGFVFAPFHRSTDFPVVFFEPDRIIEASGIDDDLIREIAELEPLYPSYEYNVPEETGRKAYDRAAGEVMASFGPGLSKVVLSRIVRVSRPASFDPGGFFFKLLSEYPAAFVHLTHIPGAGTWTGATPEMLFRSAKGKARTTAMAGTRRTAATAWGSKEREEQQMVTDHIEKVLQGCRIPGYKKQGPSTVLAGKVQHLATTFSFDPDPVNFDILGFLRRLHPTPAVCGLPVGPAMEVIRKTEKHNREYYAGFCGPLDLDGPTDLFVNLRCMKILPGDLVLYAGGGLTARSVIPDEWEETGWKAKTLLNLI